MFCVIHMLFLIKIDSLLTRFKIEMKVKCSAFSSLGALICLRSGEVFVDLIE